MITHTDTRRCIYMHKRLYTNTTPTPFDTLETFLLKFPTASKIYVKYLFDNFVPAAFRKTIDRPIHSYKNKKDTVSTAPFASLSNLKTSMYMTFFDSIQNKSINLDQDSNVIFEIC